MCLTDEAGNILVHKNLKTTPEALMRVIDPYREDLAIAVECVFVWYWIADLCARLGITFVLGHAVCYRRLIIDPLVRSRIDPPWQWSSIGRGTADANGIDGSASVNPSRSCLLSV